MPRSLAFCLALEIGNPQIGDIRSEHETANTPQGNDIPRDDKFKRLFFTLTCNCQFDFGSLLTPDILHRIHEGHAPSGFFFDPDDLITSLYPGFVGRGTLDGGNHDEHLVLDTDFNANPGEAPLCLDH